MSNYPSGKPGKEKTQRVVAGILFLSVLVLGSGTLAIASTANSMLQIQGDRITGVLRQVPLRVVLEQLQEKLAIEYLATGKELDKLVSGNFSDESLPKALSRILASWDYALKVDQQGRVKQIFVLAKARPMAIKKGTENASESVMAVFAGKAMRSETSLGTQKAQVSLSERAVVLTPEESVPVSPMFVESSNKFRPMIIQPSHGRTMPIKPASSLMQVIPASGYLPMDVRPVSEDVQMEFMKGHN